MADQRMAFDRTSARRIDEQGFLHVDGCNISKACVNPYTGAELMLVNPELGLDPNKIYRIFRPPEELAKAAPTFNNLPLMDKHIALSAFDLEKPEIKAHLVGCTGSTAEFRPPYLINSLAVHTTGAIDGVNSRERTELSSAYRYDLDMTPGSHDGDPYDGRMFNLRGNHVALVQEGRAGPDVVVADSAEALAAAMAIDGEEPGSSYELAEQAAMWAGRLAMKEPKRIYFVIAARLYKIAAQEHVEAGFPAQAEYHLQQSHFYANQADLFGPRVGITVEVEDAPRPQDVAARWPESRRKADFPLAGDTVEYVKGHRDSKGDLAPWVIRSESGGKIVWSGPTKEAAAAQLRNVEGHKKGSITKDETHGHYAGEYSDAAASGASREANNASSAAKGGGEKANRTASAAHSKAVKEHQSAEKSARERGLHEQAAQHAQAISQHRDAVVHHEQLANRAATRGMDSIVQDVAERGGVDPEAGKSKYGDVEFADQKNRKYPLDTPAHVRSALSYWGRAKNRNEYSKEDQTKITARMESAARKFKIGAIAEGK